VKDHLLMGAVLVAAVPVVILLPILAFPMMVVAAMVGFLIYRRWGTVRGVVAALVAFLVVVVITAGTLTTTSREEGESEGPVAEQGLEQPLTP